MSTIWNLVSRHNKVYRRDRVLVFFSLLSVLIVLLLYAIFLQRTQVSSIEEWIPASQTINTMVNQWMTAGLLSIIGMTTTLAAFGMYIRDKDTKVISDFLTTPNSRTVIQFSYVLNAMIIGFVLSIVGLVACQIYIIFFGGDLFSPLQYLKLLGIIIINVLLCSSLNLLLTLVVKTETAFSTLNSIVGSVIGFLCGVYVPVGLLPDFVQKTIILFPISHTATLFREVMMESSVAEVFAGSPEAEANYTEIFGVHFIWGGEQVTTMQSLIYIIVAFVVFAAAAIFIYKRKNK